MNEEKHVLETSKIKTHYAENPFLALSDRKDSRTPFYILLLAVQVAFWTVLLLLLFE